MEEDEVLRISSSEDEETDVEDDVKEDINICTVYGSDLMIAFGALVVICVIIIGHIWESYMGHKRIFLVLFTMIFLTFAAYKYVMHLHQKLQTKLRKNEEQKRRTQTKRIKQKKKMKKRIEEFRKQQEEKDRLEEIRRLKQEMDHLEQFRKQQEEKERLEEMRKQLEEQNRLEKLQKEQEERDRLEEIRKLKEERDRLEELREQQEEKHRQEEIRRQQEEKVRLEEVQKEEEERYRQEEIRREREEKDRQEQIRREHEETDRLEEIRKLQEEKDRLENFRKQQEEKDRQEEIRKQQEEQDRQEVIRKQQEEKDRLEEIRIEQQEKDRLEKESRKEELKAKLKQGYQSPKDNLMVLETQIKKERNNTNNYMDLNLFHSSLDSISLKEKTSLSDLEALYRQQVETINSTDEVMVQLNAIDSFNNEQRKINESIGDLTKQFDDLKLKFGATPSGKLARMIKRQSKLINKRNGLEIYKLPVKSTHQVQAQKLRRYELGTENCVKPHKHILLAGMTGAGKSLLVNNIINYVYGVEYKDTFRFQLVVEEEEIGERDPDASKSKAESMTSWVSSFALHHQEGFCVDYNLTIIDTPGFGDTRGIKYDELIIDQLKGFFDNEDVCPIKELSSIGLVIQASHGRITAEQKYIYDQALNVFGRDMTENIFLMFTFADAEAPPALEVVKKNEIPFNKDCTFKFNNSALYAANDNVSSDYSWVFGYSSLKKFFLDLGKVSPTSLKQTKEVLKERDNLKILLGKLQENIDSGMDMLQSIETMINDILALKGAMRANKNYKVKSKRHPQTTKVTKNSITNCISCQYTCHDPCYITGDQKRGCASMYNGKCGVCPGKCPWEAHKNGTMIYCYEEIEVEETVEDMLQKYQIAVNDKDAKKKLLLNMLDEYRSYRNKVYKDIKLASEASKRLEEIALRQSFLTNVTYIERLIKSEEFNNRPNKKVRLEQLYYFKKLALTLEQARNSPSELTVSKYEQTIMKAINNIQDEIQDYQTYFADEVAASQTAREVRRRFTFFRTFTQ